VYGVEYEASQGVGIIDDNGPETDVDGWLALVKKSGKIGFRGIRCGEVQEVETRNVNVAVPVIRLRNESRRPSLSA
jgi:hypothetical protein